MMKPGFTILLFLLMSAGFAQTNSASLRFHFLGVKDGLPEGSVNTLLQDKYGYIWVGTQNGLVRYDGYAPKVYSLRIRNHIDVNVTDIFEDRNGRLWVGSYGNELFYYDRSHDAFISYLPGVQKQDTADNYSVSNITDDSRGNIWFVLRNLTKHYTAIASFNTTAHTFQSYSSHVKGSHHVPADNLLSLAVSGSGFLLAGSDNGMYLYDDAHDTFKPCFTSADSLAEKRIVLFAPDKRNPDAVWLATGSPNLKDRKYDNLVLYNARLHSIQSYRHTQSDTGSFPGNEINAVYCATDGAIWIGSDAGLIRFDQATKHFSAYLPRDVKSTKVYETAVGDIEEDGKGNLWCVTNNGLLLFNISRKSFERHTYNSKGSNNIVESNVRSFMVDNSGTVWFGAAQMGLQWTNTSSSRFTHYQNNSDRQYYFPGGAVNEVAESKDGTMWLSADKGLYRWRPGTDSFTRIVMGKDDDYYSNSVIVDDEGLVWSRAVATNIDVMGLYCYNPATKRVTNYRNKEGDSSTISNNNIRAICQDGTGAIWAGTFGNGVCRLDKRTGRFTRYPYSNSAGSVNTDAIQKGVLDDGEVQSLYKDEGGTLWAGTNNGSLNWFDKSTNRFLPYQKPISGLHCVLSLMSDGGNRLWCGTYTSGVYLIDTKTHGYTRLSEANGLLYNGGWGMQYDSDHRVWIASPRGLTVIANGKDPLNLTTESGLPAEPLNFFLYKTRSGNFMYGTPDGFVAFNPKDIIAKPLPPPVVHIESIAFATEKNGQAYDSVLYPFGREKTELSYNQNRLTITYVGLQYQNVSLTRYQYQLEGYDKGWIDGGTQRQVTYTNLSPGSYTFRVKAINSDGIESATFDSVAIVIAPPWWKTWWAYVLYVIILTAAVWSFVVYRSKQLTAQNKLLEQRVTERTQQLNQSLTELKTTQAQLIQSEKMASLGELTAGIAHEIQNPLNFVNNFSEVNREMIAELQEEIDKENFQEVRLIAKDIADNEEKITSHGRRADAIVKNMLQHSRKSSGQKEETDINALCDEYLRLSYHGMRTKDKAFNAQLQAEFDKTVGSVSAVPQNMGRVLLNLFNNAFYAVNEKKKLSAASYQPSVGVTTKKLTDLVEIIVTDNGNGIAHNVINKIFQPFFTTKPTGEGTGLGLSLSYDIITKEHGGTLEAESKEGEGTRFVIRLPT